MEGLLGGDRVSDVLGNGPVTDHANDPALEVIGICHLCQHRRGVRTCEAFPDGIPKEIIVGDVMHTQPYPGDRGIIFKRIVK